MDGWLASWVVGSCWPSPFYAYVRLPLIRRWREQQYSKKVGWYLLWCHSQKDSAVFVVEAVAAAAAVVDRKKHCSNGWGEDREQREWPKWEDGTEWQWISSPLEEDMAKIGLTTSGKRIWRSTTWVKAGPVGWHGDYGLHSRGPCRC